MTLAEPSADFTPLSVFFVTTPVPPSITAESTLAGRYGMPPLGVSRMGTLSEADKGEAPSASGKFSPVATKASPEKEGPARRITSSATLLAVL